MLGLYYQARNDNTRALSHLTRAVERGHGKAIKPLFQLAFTISNDTTKQRQSFGISALLAERGHQVAREHLAWCHLTGCGTTRDLDQAELLFFSAFEQGSTAAALYLCSLIESGVFRGDLEMPARLERKASDAGSTLTSLNDIVKYHNLARLKRVYNMNPGLFHDTDSSGNSLLHLACNAWFIQGVEFLISVHCEVNAKDLKGFSPLALCAQNDCVEIAKLLIRAGADVHSQASNMWKSTPLDIAMAHNSVRVTEELLRAGANFRDASHQDTPVQIAVGRKSFDVAQILVAAGADLFAPTVRGVVPAKAFDAHFSEKYQHVASLLRELLPQPICEEVQPHLLQLCVE
jgi:hypothetical protein